MNDREELLGRRIATSLDRSLDDMDPRIIAKLRIAREAALERMETAPEWSFATAGPVGRGAPIRAGDPFTPARLMSIAALIAAICAMVYWQHLQHEDLVADIDSKLLSGDLPIDAYLDKGLDAWLGR